MTAPLQRTRYYFCLLVVLLRLLLFPSGSWSLALVQLPRPSARAGQRGRGNAWGSLGELWGRGEGTWGGGEGTRGGGEGTWGGGEGSRAELWAPHRPWRGRAARAQPGHGRCPA